MVVPTCLTSIISIVVFVIFSSITKSMAGIPHFIWATCITTNNYTANSFYKTNLNQVLPLLTAQSSSSFFSNQTLGSNPNKVYALYYCRGDLSLQDCNDCVSAAATQIVARCPSEMEALIFYEECTLRYSNELIFGVTDTVNGRLTWSSRNVSNPTQFLSALMGIVDELTQQAVSSNATVKYYAKGKRVVTDSQTIFCLVQCTQDLSITQCSDCLQLTKTDVRYCCESGSNYAFINLPSCRMMYDVIAFGPQQEDTPPPPSPPPAPTTVQSPKPTPTTAKGKNANIYVLAIAVPLAAAALLLGGVLLFCFCRPKNVEMVSQDGADKYTIEGASQFDLETMKAATENFSPMNKLGQGGFGVVYKGKLQNGQEVAIKRLSQANKQGLKEFMNEVQLIVKLQHKNLVRLVGFCTEGEERLVVYEFMPKLSLDYYLFDKNKSKYLSWETRTKIIEGTARGLHYLHEDSRLKVVHRDLKASNVLLDEDMNPKIADFGIAKLVLIDQTQSNTTKVIGTLGYMAPEYALAGQFSAKSDVFSFGVMVLEIVSGQSNSQQNQQQYQDAFLVHMWKCWMEGEIEGLIDPTLRNSVSTTDAWRFIHTGLLCVQYDPTSRPTMYTVLLMLNSTSMELEPPSSPSPLLHDARRVDMNPSREYQIGSDISTGILNMKKDLYPR